MNMQKLLILFFTTCFFSNLSAQQLPIFTQYRANRGFINPAAFDIENFESRTNLSFGTSIRNQWTGLQSGPKTQTIFGTYIRDMGGVGLVTGFNLVNDQADRVGYTGLYGRVGGILSSNLEDYGISFGLSLGAVQYRVDLTGLENNNDPLLASGNNKQINPDAGVGVFAYTAVGDDYLYGGLSVPQVLGLDLTFKTPDSEFNTQRIRHYYGLIGYYLDLNDDYSYIEGSAWVKYVANVPLNVDFNLRYQMGKYLWIGGGYNTGKVMHGEFGIIFGEDSIIKLGYGFDTPLSGISNFFGNTHEINIAIYLDTGEF